MANNLLLLNSTNSKSTTGGLWGGEPTATQFYKCAGVTPGASNVTYLFAGVPGFSAFGSYTANNLADGPFAPCGFRPKWVMIKNINSAGHPWHIYERAREPNNVMGVMLFANTNEAELEAPPRLDFLASGFKLRTNPGNGPNTPAGDQFIFAAFAEHPFKYARAR